jgi:hexosaminidase
MTLNYNLCRDDIKKILNEEKDILGIHFSDEGDKLISLQSEEKGFFIAKNNSEIVIRYHTITDFCRALTIICKRENEEIWVHSEKSSFEEFGIMLDFSRNAIMRVEEVKLFIKSVALMGYNFLGLYLEDTIEVPEEPYFGYMRGAMTAAQLKEIDAYANIFGMEIRAYIQTLAHLKQITRYEEYQEIVDTDDILLAGEERTYQLLENLIKAVSVSISSRKINIGMDEAHMIGLGKYLDKHGYCDRFKIMEEHLNRVMDICRKYGLQVQMWSDMFFRLAFNGEYYVNDEKSVNIPNIPSDVELVYWDYYSCDKARYDKMLKNHQKIADKVGFAGGAWKWTGFAPHNTYSMEIGKAATQACKENHIKSVVITAWGDNGGEASNFSILPALYADAEYNYTGNVDTSKFYYITGMTFEDFIQLELSNYYSEDATIHNNAGKYLLYNDVFLATFDSVIQEGISEYYKESAVRLMKLSTNERYGYLFDTQSKLCKVLQHKADLGKRIKSAYDRKDMVQLSNIAEDEIPLIIEELNQFFKAFERQWEKENKPFGFEVQCIRLGGLEKRLEYVKRQLSGFVSGEKAKIEELEAERKAFHYFEEEDINKLNYNLWHDIVSPSDVG